MIELYTKCTITDKEERLTALEHLDIKIGLSILIDEAKTEKEKKRLETLKRKISY